MAKPKKRKLRVKQRAQVRKKGEGNSIKKANRQIGNKKLNEKRIHPCQKPVALYDWLLQHFIPQGGVIFDPMLGSGSSRIAAYKLGYDYVGCEIDKEYFDKANERFKQETSQLLLFK